MGAWKSNVSVFREGKGSVWKRAYIPMLSYVYKDGYTEQSVQIRGIPAGNDYRVQEKKVLRYSLMQVTGTKNVTVKKLEEPAYGKDRARVFSVSVNLCGHPKESEVVFENQKYRWDDYGHNSIVKNRIPVE